MMSAHIGRPALLVALATLVAILGWSGLMGPGSAQAAPAQNLSVFDQSCTSSGNVRVTFVWNPSGTGTQWFDVSRSSNFATFGNEGPLASTEYFTRWTLDDNTTFFARVATFSPGLQYSNTLQFHTINCGGGFTPPSGVDVDVFSNFVRVDWNAGNDNLFYCVDTAFTLQHLIGIFGSWHNWGCGTTATQLDLTNLACGHTHFLRVWAAGPGTSGYSETVTFVSQPCDFSPPTNPRDQVLSPTSARLAWDRGVNNIFFCVDLALSQDDLEDLDGSWFNTHCGTTGTVVDVTGLLCDTQYWWRTWAAGPGTSGYTPIETFTTADCIGFIPPDAVDEDVLSADEVRFEWSENSPADLFCVDYAGSEDDLEDRVDSWRNQCVPGNVETTVVDNPEYWDCDETFFWRVFGVGPTGNGYSETRSFVMDCP
jgi:hypothetical protein